MYSIGNLLILAVTLWLMIETGNAHSIDYSSQPQVKKMIQILERNSRRCLTRRNFRYCRKGYKPSTKGTGWCYMYVKLGLLKSGMTSKYIGGGSAKDAGPHLEKEGFVNILQLKPYTPIEIPVGAIFVYKNTFSSHGHIEVKVKEDRYISDYVNKDTQGQLIGVYVKKELLNKIKEKSIGGNYDSFMCPGGASIVRSANRSNDSSNIGQ